MSASRLAGVVTCYVESSALLAALVEGDREVLRQLQNNILLAASALTLAECTRVLKRKYAMRELSAEQTASAARDLAAFERRCTVIAISTEVLARVGGWFPVEPVRTLDAIHLVTAQMLGEPPRHVLLLTRDRRVRANAQALGFCLA